MDTTLMDMFCNAIEEEVLLNFAKLGALRHIRLPNPDKAVSLIGVNNKVMAHDTQKLRKWDMEATTQGYQSPVFKYIMGTVNYSLRIAATKFQKSLEELPEEPEASGSKQMADIPNMDIDSASSSEIPTNMEITPITKEQVHQSNDESPPLSTNTSFKPGVTTISQRKRKSKKHEKKNLDNEASQKPIPEKVVNKVAELTIQTTKKMNDIIGTAKVKAVNKKFKVDDKGETNIITGYLPAGPEFGNTLLSAVRSPI